MGMYKITDEDVQIRDGMLGMDSPIFDRLAADYFAFNLGDYR